MRHEDNGDIKGLDLVWRLGLDGPMSSHGHENGSRDSPPWSGNFPGPSLTASILMDQFEFEMLFVALLNGGICRHGRSLKGAYMGQ